jgi:hypothetical protein
MAADTFVGMRHNLMNPSDVNMDGTASPIDALMIIDELNRSNKSIDPTSRMMADTNNDGFVSPVDVLVVIDTLNAEFVFNMPNLPPGATSGGSGENPQDEVTAVDDYQLVYVAIDAIEKPEVEIDVLMNDIGQGLSIVEVVRPQLDPSPSDPPRPTQATSYWSTLPTSRAPTTIDFST